jgi:hypothetical protein
MVSCLLNYFQFSIYLHRYTTLNTVPLRSLVFPQSLYSTSGLCSVVHILSLISGLHEGHLWSIFICLHYGPLWSILGGLCYAQIWSILSVLFCGSLWSIVSGPLLVISGLYSLCYSVVYSEKSTLWTSLVFAQWSILW